MYTVQRKEKKRKIVGEAATLPILVRGSPCHRL
jgi:hypothetical protein